MGTAIGLGPEHQGVTEERRNLAHFKFIKFPPNMWSMHLFLHLVFPNIVSYFTLAVKGIHSILLRNHIHNDTEKENLTLHLQNTYHMMVDDRPGLYHTLVFSSAEADQIEYETPHIDHLEENKPRGKCKHCKVISDR